MASLFDVLKNKIVLIPFPFDDLSGSKVRPVMCLTEPIGPHSHVVVAFITSQTPAALLASDIVIGAGSSDFSLTGLRTTSVLQIHRLATVTEDIMLRELGELSPLLQQQVRERLYELFSEK